MGTGLHTRGRGQLIGRALLVAVICLCMGCASTARSVVRLPSRSSRRVRVEDIFGNRGRRVSGTTPRKVAFEDAGAASTGFTLREGDHVVVYLRGIPEERMIEDVVDEEGCITLPYLGRVRVQGMTTAQVEKRIRQEYINNKIYNDLAVNVVLPTRSFFVRGEVRQPGRFPLMGEMTLSRAIASAGGYTEFANPKKIRIIRGQRTFYVNAREIERYPERDIPITPGDVIVVPRSIF